MRHSRRNIFFLIAAGMVLFIAGAAVAADQGVKINLNTAGVDQLVQLKGIGPVIANKIVADRKANGPFKSVDDLLRVKGIGPKILANIRDRVTVGEPGNNPKSKKD